MRNAGTSRRLVASILVIGLLAVALTLVCSESVHFSGRVSGACTTMSHTSGVSAVLGSESSQTLVPQLLILVAAFALLIVWFEAPAQLVPLGASPGIPPDPLHGRLRL